MTEPTGSVWFCRASGICTDYFIIGNPQKGGEAYVFARDTQTGKVRHYRMIGVFDDHKRVTQMPEWVRQTLLGVLLPNADLAEAESCLAEIRAMMPKEWEGYELPFCVLKYRKLAERIQYAEAQIERWENTQRGVVTQKAIAGLLIKHRLVDPGAIEQAPYFDGFVTFENVTRFAEELSELLFPNAAGEPRA